MAFVKMVYERITIEGDREMRENKKEYEKHLSMDDGWRSENVGYIRSDFINQTRQLTGSGSLCSLKEVNFHSIDHYQL